MGSFIYTDIDKVILTDIPEKILTADDIFPINPELRKIYEDNRYDDLPKTEKESKKTGIKPWNEISPSIMLCIQQKNANRNLLRIFVGGVRYLYCKSYQILREKNHCGYSNLNYNSLQLINFSIPMLIGVSLISIVEWKGMYYIISQIKKKSDKTFLITTLVSGMMQMEDLNKKNPTRHALNKESLEEIGIPLSAFKIGKIGLIAEEEVGRANLTFFAKNVNLLIT